MREVIAAIAGMYLFVTTTCVLLWWCNMQASWASSAAGAAVNGALQWFSSAGTWLIQTLW